MVRERRLNVNMPGTYTYMESTYKCEITDLSVSGLQIYTKQVLEVGDLLRINVYLEGREAVFFCIVKNKGENGTTFGLKMEELHPDSREVLDNYINQLLSSKSISAHEEVSLAKF